MNRQKFLLLNFVKGKLTIETHAIMQSQWTQFLLGNPTGKNPSTTCIISYENNDLLQWLV